MSEPVQPEGRTPGQLAHSPKRNQPVAEASHAAVGHAAEARGGAKRVIVEQGGHHRAGPFRAQDRRGRDQGLGAARQFAMEIDSGRGGAGIGDRYLAEFVPRSIPAPQAGNEQGQRNRPTQLLREDGVGDPEAQKLRAGVMASHMEQHMRGRSQREPIFVDRAFSRAENIGQSVGQVEAERRRDVVEDAGVDAG